MSGSRDVSKNIQIMAAYHSRDEVTRNHLHAANCLSSDVSPVHFGAKNRQISRENFNKLHPLPCENLSCRCPCHLPGGRCAKTPRHHNGRNTACHGRISPSALHGCPDARQRGGKVWANWKDAPVKFPGTVKGMDVKLSVGDYQQNRRRMTLAGS